MKITFIGIVLFLFSLLSAQQAVRDNVDSTDILEINPLHGLHYIELSIEKDIFEKKGITDKKPADNFYFRVEGEEDYTKVSYFGNNLTDYVTNVEPAYNIMTSYRNLKMTHSGLLWGGIAIAAAGAAITLSGAEISPVLFIGLGSFSISWIPRYFSHDKIPEAIGVYNESIGKFQAYNGAQNAVP